MIEKDERKRMETVEKQIIEIDIEWVTLIRQAKDLGLSIEEVREFIQGGANPKITSFSRLEI